MNRRIGQTIPVIFMILLLLLGFGRGSAFAQKNEEIVEQFFPQRLIDESVQDFQKGGPEPFKTSNFVVADLNGDGTTFIIAAYSNGFSGVVRILRKENGTFSLAYEPNLPAMSGDFPKIELLDLDNDGRPEVIVSLFSPRGTSGDWIFKWDGTKLNVIGPTEVSSFGGIFTKLSDASFIDIDGDGIREIVNPTGLGPVAHDLRKDTGTPKHDVYSFDGEKYTLMRSLYFLESFFLRKGRALAETSSFLVREPGDSFSLTIVNGDENGERRVSSAVLRLNGKVILGPDDLSREVRSLVRQVTLLTVNVLEVELRGEMRGKLMVTVGP